MQVEALVASETSRATLELVVKLRGGRKGACDEECAGFGGEAGPETGVIIWSLSGSKQHESST